MRIQVVATILARLLMGALVIASGRSECQEPGEEEAAAAAAQGCQSVVLVQCAQPVPESAQVDAPQASREAARRKLQSRRLRQMQSQAGLSAVEITGERPARTDSDAWEDFRQSMAAAAVPDCFSPNTIPAAQGLLRLPVLAGASMAGKCR